MQRRPLKAPPFKMLRMHLLVYSSCLESFVRQVAGMSMDPAARSSV